MSKMSYLLTGVLAAMVSLSASAQTDAKPVVKQFVFNDGAIIRNLSDNGEWAVAYGASEENTLYSKGARLVNVATEATIDLVEGLNSDTILTVSANDVTNDGNIVCGQLNQMPAIWNRQTKTWRFFATTDDYDTGEIISITPDGKYAVGMLVPFDDEFKECTALWDVTTGRLIATPGIPTLDASHKYQDQNRFTQISADGNVIVGTMSVSYLPSGEDLGGICSYIYNRTTESYTMMGFTESTTQPWTPVVPYITHVERIAMSPNAKYATGDVHMAVPQEGSEYPNEFNVAYDYNYANNTLSLFDKSADQSVVGWCIDNDGSIFAAGPVDNMYRDWNVRSGNYWVPAGDILKQIYGYDIYAQLGIANSGTPMAVDTEGRTFAVFAEPGNSYVLQLPEKASKLAAQVDLLGQYKVAPAAGAAISKLQSLSITFTHPVEVLGKASEVKILDENGTAVYGATACKTGDNTNVINVTFRKGDLAEGKNYTLFIPADMLQIAGDATRKNSDIRIAYTGRANVPVELTKVSPADGNAIARIDASTSPIILTFDVPVKISNASARGLLYREGENVPAAELLLSYGSNIVMAYPATTQYLYKGVNYHVAIPAGLITDVTNNAASANDSITLSYEGAYEREISGDETKLFSADFSVNNGLNNFLLLDGDELTPSDEAKELGFADAVNYPWWVIHDDDSNDFCAASHSMYTPAGKSSDWMVIPQIHIPDMLCTLEFKAQSYKKNAVDSLKVYAWENNTVFNAFSVTLAERVLSEGKVIFAERLSPGDTEEKITGEWTDYTVSLKDFAGKNMYFAFVNENENGSLVFVDTIQVLHNVPFLVTLDTESSVVKQEKLAVKGRVAIDDASKTFNSIELTLCNAAAETVSTIKAANLALKKGDIYSFTFPEELSLTQGRANEYKVVVKLTDEAGKVVENAISATVNNLAFTPTKRVVLEEFTGVDCPNCPLGILAIQNINNIYGDRFIPMAVHTYSGDPMGTGLSNYSAFLNFSAAPQGCIQRAAPSAPMMSIAGDYVFSSPTDKLWLQQVQDEMEKLAAADVYTSAMFDATTQTIETEVHANYALSAEKQNVSVFSAVLENGIVGYQKNNLNALTDPDLGEFAKGGEYGKTFIVPFTHNHVVRQVYGTTFNGTVGLLPTSFTAGTTYKTHLSLPLPATVKDTEQMEVVVMLIDNNTGAVINASKSKVGTLTNGIDTPELNTNLNTAIAPAAQGIFTLSGVRISSSAANVDSLAPGIYVVNGKKIIKK